MDIKGTINEANVSNIFYSIYSQKETGVLYVKNKRILKTIYFNQGNIAFAISNQNEDRLGEVLLKEGMISLDQYYESSARISKSKKQGAILVDMKAIAADDLIKAVTFQVKSILYSVFNFRQGQYIFKLKPGLQGDNIIMLHISIPNTILEALRRISSWQCVETALFQFPMLMRRVFGYGKLIKNMELTSQEYAVLQAVEAPMSVEDICQKSDLPDYDVCHIIWRLLSVALLERIPSTKLRKDDITNQFPYTYGLVQKYNEFFTLAFDMLQREFGGERDTIIRDHLDPLFRQHMDILEKESFYKEGFFEARQLIDRLPAKRDKDAVVIVTDLFQQILSVVITVCDSYLSKDQLPHLINKAKDVKAHTDKL